MGLNVFLLGHVGMECDGQQVAGPALGRLGRVALAYLVTERHRPVPHPELADVLWGEDPPRSWQQLVRGTVAKLRTALGDFGFKPTELLTTRFGCYQFHLPTGASVDVDTASAAVEAAVAALAMGDLDQAQTEATTASALTSRQFVPGGAGLWIERRQAELHELQLHALEVLADAATAGQRFDRAILAAETAISLEPFRESSYHRLIAAHAAGNHRGEALQAYDRCRVALAEHLGVAPSAETETLYLRLLGTEPEASPPSPVIHERVPLPPSLELLRGGLLVGRTDEQAALYGAFERTGSEGRQAMFVAGEPGAGKTSVVADLARTAHAAGGLVLYGRCDEDLGLAFQPIAEALGAYVSHMPQAELDAHVRRWGGELSRLTADLMRRVPTAPAPVFTDPEDDRFRLFQAVSDLLERAAAARPVVLVLDDLHWAAPPTVLLIRHLVRNLQNAPVLLVGTYRHTELPKDGPLAGALADFRRESAVERILLEGLDDAAVQAILEATQRDDEERDLRPIALAIHGHTGGNPFFVVELARHLQETGAVFRKQEGWSYYADASDAGIPHGVRDVVGRRLGRLSGAANEALVFAAVIGVEFELSVLELTTATETRDQVLDAIEEAVAGHLAIEVGAGAYRFAHALVRDTIYDGLSSTRRARLHWRIGEAFESLHRDLFTDHAVLAHHFAEGAAAGGGWKAAEYAVLAADQALDGAAWEDAVGFLERAVTVFDLSPSTDFESRFEVFIRMADIWNRHFAPDQALVATGSAVDAARNLGSSERLARAAEASLAASAALRGPEQEDEVRAAIALVEEVLPALGESAPGLRATLLARLAQRRLIDGCDAEALLEQALRLARQSANPNELAIALLAGCAASRGSPRNPGPFGPRRRAHRCQRHRGGPTRRSLAAGDGPHGFRRPRRLRGRLPPARRARPSATGTCTAGRCLPGGCRSHGRALRRCREPLGLVAGLGAAGIRPAS